MLVIPVYAEPGLPSGPFLLVIPAHEESGLPSGSFLLVIPVHAESGLPSGPFLLVIPANAGIHFAVALLSGTGGAKATAKSKWIPAFAGMTINFGWLAWDDDSSSVRLAPE